MLQMPNTIWMGKSCLVVNWQLYLLKRTERNHLKWGQESVIGKNYYVWRHYFGMNLTISVVFLLRNICLQCLCNFLLIYNFICIWCCFLVSPFILLSHHYVLQSHMFCGWYLFSCVGIMITGILQFIILGHLVMLELILAVQPIIPPPHDEGVTQGTWLLFLYFVSSRTVRLK